MNQTRFLGAKLVKNAHAARAAPQTSLEIAAYSFLMPYNWISHVSQLMLVTYEGPATLSREHATTRSCHSQCGFALYISSYNVEANCLQL